jgi:hypothetical protein
MARLIVLVRTVSKMRAESYLVLGGVIADKYWAAMALRQEKRGMKWPG